MKLEIFLSLALAATLLVTTSHARSNPILNPIRLISNRMGIQTGRFPPLDQHANIANCAALFWGSETNNIRDWDVVPAECVGFVKNYMETKTEPSNLSQYERDLATLGMSIELYLEDHPASNDGKDVVVFDISETLLSNLPYYRRPDVNYGSIPFNRTKYNEWIKLGEAPPVPFMPALYDLMQSLEYKIVIISGLSTKFQSIIEDNLKNAGYENWFKLVLKNETELISTRLLKAVVRAKLVANGYRIVANIGDQWRGITGSNAGDRTFKVPNPMYYLE